MGLDIGALVAPLSEDQPSGPDLYGDPDRQAIEDAFERSVSVDSSDGEDTDWRGTLSLICAQAETTRDLWLPVYMMRAGARSGDFEAVCDGADLLAGLLEERWDDVHPQLDEVGFIGRKAPCEALTRIADFLGPLQRVPLISHSRLGRYSGADFVRFAEQGANAENYGMFRALMAEAPGEDIELVAERVAAIEAALRRADAALTARAEGDTSTNFQPAYQVLAEMTKAIRPWLPKPPAEDQQVEEAGGAPVSPGAPGPGFSGGIASRRDVERALDAICDYYARNEPASPVPFVLRRAREWISLDFMSVLEDIAPGGIDEASKLLKSTRVATNNNAGWDDGTASSGSDAGWSSSSSSSDDGWS